MCSLICFVISFTEKNYHQLLHDILNFMLILQHQFRSIKCNVGENKIA